LHKTPSAFDLLPAQGGFHSGVQSGAWAQDARCSLSSWQRGRAWRSAGHSRASGNPGHL